ncbi:hypothetical protein DAI22_03g415800 [Oryza sativa Japonica Group]|nr:hypothetical protein DAI22_03g415800 [Oryza sativa Japonica Group]
MPRAGDRDSDPFARVIFELGWIGVMIATGYVQRDIMENDYERVSLSRSELFKLGTLYYAGCAGLGGNLFYWFMDVIDSPGARPWINTRR